MLLLTTLWTVAQARSGGLYLAADAGFCNPMFSKIGCYSSWNLDMTDSHRVSCRDPGGNTNKMWWVGYPKPSVAHTIRTADGHPLADPTTYKPGELMPIYLRTLQARQNYRGILLFAVNDQEQKVGDWELTDQQENYVGLVPAHVCNRSVMHIDGNNKNYLEVFYFRAPPVGTGTITFRGFLKTGPPNPTQWGDFWWTNNLTLTEAPPGSSTPWFIVPPGQSCDSACQAQGSTCSPSSLTAFNTPADFFQQSAYLSACDQALEADCTSDPPSVTPNEECSLHATECGSGYSTSSAVTCSAVSTTAKQYFCVCGEWSPPVFVPPPRSPASKTGVSLLALAFAGLTGFFSMRKSHWALSIVLALVALQPVSAHNWVEGTRGRAPFANTILPTFPQMDPSEMRLQVNPGQNFLVEWAAAHGDSTYFVMYHADNESFAARHNRVLLDDYLANCPTNASANAQTPLGQKYEWAAANINIADTSSRDPTNPTVFSNAQMFSRIVPPGDPGYLPRRPPPPTFPSRICNKTGTGYFATGRNLANCSEFVQLQFLPSRIQTDARCEYISQKYPWIEAVHRYQHNNFVVVIDTALVRIPARDGPGRYQVHYLWSSYRDTIDVDVTQKTVTNIYGKPAPANMTPYGVADHCMFEDPTSFGSSCIEIVTNHQQCLDYCSRSSGCQAVQVLPYRGPAPFPTSTMIPWEANQQYCNRTLWGRPMSDDAYVCYTVSSYRPDNNGAQSPWTYYRDPENIGFYGTCYVKQRSTLWDTTPSEPVLPDPAQNQIKFGFSCLPCDEYGLKSTVKNAVNWHPSPCVDCVKYPSTNGWRSITGPTPPAWTQGAAGFFRVPNTTCANCVKWLSPNGSPVAWDDECRILASQDQECSQNVAYSDVRAKSSANNYRADWTTYRSSVRSCACWKKSCCGIDTPTNSTTSTTYAGSFPNTFRLYTLSPVS